MHRFYLPEAKLIVGQSVDLTPVARQLTRVLRLSPGAQIVLFNGDGHEYRTEVTGLGPGGAVGQILTACMPATEPPIGLTLYQCSLKGDKFEWVLQKGTELGVSCFVPVVSAHSIVRPVAALRKKYARWQAILREAAEQSGRVRVPTLAEPLSVERAIEGARGVRLLPYETAASVPSLSVAVETLHCNVSKAGEGEEAVETLHCNVSTGVALLIGPEGGFAPEEVALARHAGWQIVTLGPRILRAETAALAAVAIIIAHCDA
jgi:16S rRNA (uracil1498-N3)-methyltransferase